MEETKPFYLSKTFYAMGLLIIAPILKHFGVQFSDETVQFFAETLTTMAGLALGIYARLGVDADTKTLTLLPQKVEEPVKKSTRKSSK